MANTKEEGDDYSGYFKKPEPAQKKTAAPVSPLQELPANKKLTKRATYLFIILIVLIGAQIVLMLTWNQNTTSAVPEGYRLVTPPDQPAYLEPIQ